MTAYLCHSDEDRRQLMRILDEIYGQQGRGSKPRIFTSRFLDRSGLTGRLHATSLHSTLLIALYCTVNIELV